MIGLKQLAEEALGRHRSTPTLVAEALREAILQGVIKSGQPLRQEEIAAHFGLSRIPVREALRQLEGEGLITFSPHRGAVVTRLLRSELQEICEIRVALEVLALQMALPQLTAEALQQMATILDETDADHEGGEHWTTNNWRFHAALYSAAGKTRLLKIIKNLFNTVDPYLRLHLSLLDYKERGQREHRMILAACANGDNRSAIALLTEHIRDVATLLGPYLEQD